MTEKYLSIIVPVFNAETTLEKCLQAISRIKNFNKCELIVVDDCSTDSSLEIAKKYTNKIIINSQNRGGSFTRNLGAKSASSKFLLFVDSDVVLSSENILEYLKEGFLRSDICGVVGVYKEEIVYENFFSGFKHLDMCFHEKTYPKLSPGAPSAIMAVSRDIFLKSGGFNENFSGVMAEDIEFSVKLSCQTGKLWLKEEKIEGVHFKKYTFFNLLKTDYLRVKGLAVITQRKDFRENYLKSCPSSALLPLMSALLTAMLLFLSFFYFNFLWSGLMAFLLFFLIKFKFLKYLEKKRNIFFALTATFFSFFEMLFAGFFAFYWQLIYKFKKINF